MSSALDVLTWRPGHPLRPPDWRWRLARLLVDGGPLARAAPPPDPDTARARSLVCALDASQTEAARLAVFLQEPEAADAYSYWAVGEAAGAAPAAPDHGPPLLPEAMARAALEALVLANKTPAAVAKVVGLAPAAVRWYEAFYFDVRDRLGRPGWVATRVVGNLYDGHPTALLPALVRAYGYYSKSARVVRAVLGTFDKAATCAAAAGGDVGRFFAADAVAAGGLKAALATRLAPLSAKTYARLIELHHEAVELSTKAQPIGGAAEDQFRRALADFSAGLSQAYGDPALQGAPPRPRLVAAGGDDD